jgi:hypothetical protein
LREVELISVAVHRNLLRLIGFCTTQTERLLVYPFMQNLSVAYRVRGIIFKVMHLALLCCSIKFVCMLLSFYLLFCIAIFHHSLNWLIVHNEPCILTS